MLPGHLIRHTTLVSQSHKFNLPQNVSTIKPRTYAWYTTYTWYRTSNLRLWLRPTLNVIPLALRLQKNPLYNLTSKGSDNQSFFINGSESWKISSSLLELEHFICALSMEVLKPFILALLLDDHVQVVKSWKISCLLFESEDFIFALSMDVLEGFLLALLLKATGRMRKNGRPWLLYNWCLATPKTVRLETIDIWKKLHYLIELAYFGVLAPTLKAKRCRCWSRKSKIRRS